MACMRNLTLFRFLISHRAPNGMPNRCTDTLTSHRSEPCISVATYLVHVAVRRADAPQQVAHFAHVRASLFRRAHRRRTHDLDQRDAGAVKVEQLDAPALAVHGVVRRLGRVLLELHLLDGDVDRIRLVLQKAVLDPDRDTPFFRIGDWVSRATYCASA